MKRPSQGSGNMTNRKPPPSPTGGGEQHPPSPKGRRPGPGGKKVNIPPAPWAGQRSGAPNGRLPPSVNN